MEAYVSGRNFNTFIHSKYVCSPPAEARATIGQFSITSCPNGARIPAALHHRIVGPQTGGGTGRTGRNHPARATLSSVRSSSMMSCKNRIIGQILRGWFRPVTHIHGARDRIGRQNPYMIDRHVHGTIRQLCCAPGRPSPGSARKGC